MKDTNYIWAIGIEHETQMLYYPLSQSIKNYEIIDAVAGDELNKNELDSLTFKNKNNINII